MEFVAKVRGKFPEHTIMVSQQTTLPLNLVDGAKNKKVTLISILLQAGNVVTGDMVEALVFAGADIIKVIFDLLKIFIRFVSKGVCVNRFGQWWSVVTQNMWKWVKVYPGIRIPC